MKTLLLATTALVAMSVASIAAVNDVKPYHRSGYWLNFAGHNVENVYVCGMLAYGKFDNATEMLMVKYYADKDSVDLEVTKTSWKIPRNAPNLKFTFGFDTEEYGSTSNAATNSSDNTLAIHLPQEHVGDFLNTFAHSDLMWITFPDGNEQGWKFDMKGSREAASAFAACKSQAANATPPAAPSQPFSSSSQPFDNKKANDNSF